MNKYLGESGELSEEEIKKALRARCHRGRDRPDDVRLGVQNKGVQAMLDAVIDYMPTPTRTSAGDEAKLENGQVDERMPRRTTRRSRRSRSRS